MARKLTKPGTTKPWQALWVDPWGDRRTKCFRLKAEAERHERLMQDQVANGTYGMVEKGSLPFSQMASELEPRQTARKRPSTVSKTASHMKLILLFFGDMKLGKLNRGDGEDFVLFLQDRGLSPAYIRGVLSTLARLISMAVDRDYLMRSFMPDMKSLDIEVPTKRVDKVLEDAEVRRIIRAVPARLRPLYEMYAYCGLRQREGLGVTRDRVDVKNKMVKIDRQLSHSYDKALFGPPKNRSSSRDVELPDTLAVKLAAHMLRHRPGPDGLLFTTEDGGPLWSHSEYRTMKAACREAGVDPKVSAHNLRHYWYSMQRRGESRHEDIAPSAGHSSTRHGVLTYTHAFEGAHDRLRRVAEAAMQEAAAEDEREPDANGEGEQLG